MEQQNKSYKFLEEAAPELARKFTITYFLLPPANEVWCKVTFSEACAKNSVHRGVCLSACWDTPPGPSPPP